MIYRYKKTQCGIKYLTFQHFPATGSSEIASDCKLFHFIAIKSKTFTCKFHTSFSMFLNQITVFTSKLNKKKLWMEITDGKTSFSWLVYLISLLCSLYTIDGKISDRQ